MNLFIKIKHKRSLQLSSLFIVFTMLMITGIFVSPAQKAAALTASSFNPGHIIDDGVFTDSTAMSVNDIQNFLNAQVPVCDTNGTQPAAGHPGLTRAQWGAEYDAANNTTIGAAPYVCLKDYMENTSAGTNNLQNPRTIPGAISAAQIIYNASQQYGINPEVILTTLQKEQGLITDDWPWTNEYTEALGFNCPDTGPCSGYGDFYLQVNAAAKQFRNYLTNPNNFNYVVGNNNILYAPGCSSGPVNILNQATAALYDYTPYQPNAAVLAATNPTGSSLGPGGSISGSCGAYGNRNFWWYFNTWFGNSLGSNPISPTMSIVGAVTSSPAAPIPGQPVTVTYTVENTGTLSQTLDVTLDQCRFNTTGICGAAVPWGGSIIIAAGTTHTFTDTYEAATAGAYTFTPFFEQNGTWWLYNSTTADNLTYNVPAYVAPMELTTPITVSPTSPIPGQDMTVSYTVENTGTLPAIYQTGLDQCRINTTGICGQSVPWVGAITIAAGATHTFTDDFGLATAGTYTFTPYYSQNNNWYKYSAVGISGGNTLTVTVPAYVAPMELTTPITVSPTSPIPGQDMTVSYTVENTGTLPAIYQTGLDQCRINTTGICGQSVPWVGAITIAAGATHTFTDDFGLATAGTYTFTPYYSQNNNWYKYSAVGISGGNTLTVTVPAYVAPMELTTPITVSPTSPIPGQDMTVSYTVENTGTLPAIYQTGLDQCRINTTGICGQSVPWVGAITIAAGATHTFTDDFGLATAGTYTFTPYYSQNNNWYKYSAVGISGGNTLTVTVPAYVAPMELTTPITVSPTSPIPGQDMTVSYTVENTGTLPAIYQTGLDQCRINTTGICGQSVPWVGAITIAAGATHTFTDDFGLATAGTYTFTPYYSQNNNWYKYSAVGISGGNTLTVTVP